MKEIVHMTLSRLRSAWTRLLVVHLIYTGLGIVFFAPFLGLLGRLLLKLSGQPALADMDLLYFALSPAGFIALILFVAVGIVISVFELASMMVIATDAAGRRTVDIARALGYSLRKVRQVFELAARLVIRILAIVVPFVLAAALVAYLLISEHDINYYLSVQPPKFWAAAFGIGTILVALLVFLVQRLIGWSLILPLILFAGAAPSEAFAVSRRLTRNNAVLVLQLMAVWAGITFVAGVLVTVATRQLASVLMPLFIDSVNSLVLMFGLLALLWAIGTALAAALATGMLALILVSLLKKLEPGLLPAGLKPSSQSLFRLPVLTQRWLATGLFLLAGAAALLGYFVLKELQPVDQVQIIAHRGASKAAPENTMAAIRRAMKDGADWIEIDVQESADGEVVVIHDSDLMKLAGVDLKVWDATLERLSSIDIGSWFAQEFAGERVPTLASVLAEVKGSSRLIIELKYYGKDQQLEQRVIDLVEAAGMQDDVMIMSLEYAGIQKVRDLRPDWKIGLLSARAVGDLTRLDADFLAVNVALAKQRLIRTAHAAGKKLYVWTVNDALSMSQLMSLGVDGVITDEPLLGHQVLSARAQLSSVERLLLHVAPLIGLEAPSLDIQFNDAQSDGDNISLELSLHQSFQDRISALDNVLAEFATDGCSGGLSIGWDHFARQVGFFRERHGKLPPWEACCVSHDRAYHTGGGRGLSAIQSFSARERADSELRACVLAIANERADDLVEYYGLERDRIAGLYDAIADTMYTAVRVGGMPCTGLSWRWGYGWPTCH